MPTQLTPSPPIWISDSVLRFIQEAMKWQPIPASALLPSGTWVEVTGTEGMLVIDDTHRDVIFNTMEHGIRLPMSTMPGEPVGHVFAGPMHAETVHWIEAVAFDRPEMCSAAQARRVMEVYMAADLSAERHEAVTLPLSGPALSSAAA